MGTACQSPNTWTTRCTFDITKLLPPQGFHPEGEMRRRILVVARIYMFWFNFLFVLNFNYLCLNSLVEVTMVNSTVLYIVNGSVSVAGNFHQFKMVNFTLVNFHDYGGKKKDSLSPITIRFTRKKKRWVYP